MRGEYFFMVRLYEAEGGVSQRVGGANSREHAGSDRFLKIPLKSMHGQDTINL